jgi:hypothetical protein
MVVSDPAAGWLASDVDPVKTGPVGNAVVPTLLVLIEVCPLWGGRGSFPVVVFVSVEPDEPVFDVWVPSAFWSPADELAVGPPEGGPEPGDGLPFSSEVGAILFCGSCLYNVVLCSPLRPCKNN